MKQILFEHTNLYGETSDNLEVISENSKVNIVIRSHRYFGVDMGQIELTPELLEGLMKLLPTLK